MPKFKDPLPANIETRRDDVKVVRPYPFKIKLNGFHGVFATGNPLIACSSAPDRHSGDRLVQVRAAPQAINQEKVGCEQTA